MSRRRILTSAIVALLAASLSACGGSSGGADKKAGGSFTIGTAVIVSHPSLQLVRDGFEDVLNEKGVDVEYIDENAQGDQNNAVTIASTFADNSAIDLILAISTPIAQAIVQVEKERPVLYTAVTDPVEAGLVPFIDQPSGTNVTGTSDLNPNGAPVTLITEMIPGAKTVGVVYSSAEANSLVQVKTIKDEAAGLGVEIKESAITNSSELATGVQALAGVDAILVPTDNTVVSGLATVVGFGEQNKIPVFTVDPSSLSQGAVAARGLSYYELGRRTGEMAYQILVEEVDVATVPALVAQETEVKVNKGAAEKMGLTIPPAILEKATLVETGS